MQKKKKYCYIFRSAGIAIAEWIADSIQSVGLDIALEVLYGWKGDINLSYTMEWRMVQDFVAKGFFRREGAGKMMLLLISLLFKLNRL